MKPQILTTSQYAKQEKISRVGALMRIKKGKVNSFRIGKFYFVALTPIPKVVTQFLEEYNLPQ